MDYKEDGLWLMQGDCMERMKEVPNNSIDLVLTDPPFGMSWQSGHRRVKHKKIENDSSLEWLPGVIGQSYRVMRENTSIVVFCSWRHIDTFKQAVESLFTLKNIVVWNKNNHGTGDLKGSFAPKHEFAIFATKGRVELIGNRKPDVIDCEKTNNLHHPTEKPVKLMSEFVESLCPPEGVVFDPFMGSGTAGVAARRLGRAFTGIELDVDYFETAKRRILNDGSQLF